MRAKIEFNPDKDEFISNYKRLKSCRKMEELYKINFHFIIKFANSIGFKNKEKNNHWRPSTDEEFIKNYTRVKSSDKMAEIYNVDCNTILSYAKRIGFANKYRAELSEEERKYIIDNYFTMRSDTLAIKFNVSQSLIKKVWKENCTKDKPRYTYYSDFDYFEKLDSKDKAYFLGFIAADGCVYKRDRHQYQLSIGIHEKDRDLLEKFKKYTKSDNPITSYEKVSDNGIKSIIVEFVIVSDKLCNDLGKFNIIPNKTWTFEPDNIPKEFMSHFIRGYFDGDGCLSVSKKGRFVPSFVGNEKTMKYIADELKNNFIKYSIRQDTREYTHDFYEVIVRAESVNLFLEYIYKDCDDLRLDRKFAIRDLKLSKDSIKSERGLGKLGSSNK